MKLSSILVASVLLLSGSAFAQDRPVAHPPPNAEESTHYGWADVLRVDPLFDQTGAEVPAMRQECRDEQIEPPPSANQGDSRVGGTVIGAIVGGVIGNLFGKGDGRKAATAVGAVAGGVVGNNIAAASDAAAADNNPPPGTQRHCREVPATNGQRRIVGYDVEYRYRGEIYMARLPYDPGDRLRVRVSVTPVE